MNDYLLQKKIADLPENIRYAIEHFDWESEIIRIGHTYHLQIDMIQALRDEILAVMIGEAPADHFESNIEHTLEIPRPLAENIVNEANELIFIPLQKLAFSHKEPTRETYKTYDPYLEPIDDEDFIKEDLSLHMAQNGVQLVDEETSREQPQNELQNLANQLFQEKKEREDTHTTDTSLSEKLDNEEQENIRETENSRQETGGENQKTEISSHDQYREKISDEDLLGIHEHRIDTSILKKEDKKTPSFDEKLLQTPHISHTDEFDFSPTKEEQIKERGDFLKHIGAS